MATGPDGKQIIDVNGTGVNFTLVNAVEAAIGDNDDDQGEQTDPCQSRLCGLGRYQHGRRRCLRRPANVAAG
eukprot:2102159-Pleurochrysis_carterae.AAC.1